jgi:hypothetical protein
MDAMWGTDGVTSPLTEAEAAALGSLYLACDNLYELQEALRAAYHRPPVEPPELRFASQQPNVERNPAKELALA